MSALSRLPMPCLNDVLCLGMDDRLRTLRLEKADDATCIPQSSYTQHCLCVWSIEVGSIQ